MRTFRVATGLAFAAAAGACLFPSFDELGGAASFDAGEIGDATRSDGAGPSDAAPDVTDGSVSDGSGYVQPCDAGAFCDNFDDPKSTTVGNWTMVSACAGCSVTRAPPGLSAPNALVGIINGSDAAGVTLDVELIKSFMVTANGVHVSYDFAVDQFDDNPANVVLGQVVVRSGSAQVNVRLRIETGPIFRFESSYRVDGGMPTPQNFGSVSVSSTADASAWHHVELDLDVSTMPATASFTIDSTSLSDGGYVSIAGATYGPGSLQFIAPGYANAPTTGWRFRFDNVVVTPR